MKRGATKEEIIRMTQTLIARNGIRAVRVDEIAQALCISKRTLYELFADKDELVNACLDDMSRQQQLRIAGYNRRHTSNPLQKTLRLMGEYVDSLYQVERSFLADITSKAIYAEQIAEHRAFWRRELADSFKLCQTHTLLLKEVDPVSFANQCLGAMLDLRQNQVAREELYLFSRTILRGAATREGIELIDAQRA